MFFVPCVHERDVNIVVKVVDYVMLGEPWLLQILILPVARMHATQTARRMEETCAACNDTEQKIHFSNLEGTKTSGANTQILHLWKYVWCH